jgi:hypothetical protein
MARFAEIDRVHQGLLSVRRAIDRWRSLPPTLRSVPGDRWAACLSAHLIVRCVAFRWPARSRINTRKASPTTTGTPVMRQR